MTELDNLIVSEVLRWGNADKCLSQNDNQENEHNSVYCCECNDGTCYDCPCDNDSWCREG